MESSTVLAFRIFVMLSCLIVVPMAAIFGSAFPDVVKSVLVDRIVAWSTGKSPDSANATEGGFSEVTPGGAGGAARGGTGNWEAPRWGAQAAAPNGWQGQPSSPQNTGVIPAGAQGINPLMGPQSASFAAVADAGRAPAPDNAQQRPGGESPYRPPGSDHSGPVGQPLSHPANAIALAPGDMRGSMTGQGGQQPSDQPERFTTMEHRLREYGATYYLLETWGNEGDLYRFHCKMAIGNNPNYTRHFEATDHDALKAMAAVLEKVEAWRAGRLQ